MARISKSAVLDYMCMDVAKTYNIQVSDIVSNLEETPQQLRHSCMPTGITFLPIQYYPVQTEDAGLIQYPYYLCTQCGKLYTYKYLYDY